MKITFYKLSQEAQYKFDYRNIIKIKIDDKIVFKVSDGEPEDNTINRNFNDILKIPELFGIVYDAGRMDDGLEMEWKEIDDIDEMIFL